MHEEALFYIGSLGITSIMITMAGITVILSLICIIGTRHLQMIPTGFQAILEKSVEALDNFITETLGKETGRRLFPLLATMFIFILISNYSGLLPMSGKLPGLEAPTSSLSVTVSLALITFFTTHYAGVKAHGIGYLKHFIRPVIFLAPLFVLDELVRPLSLSIRLYGNIFGDESVTEQFFQMVPLGLPLTMNAFVLLMGFVQALVFLILSSIYIGGAIDE